MTKCKTGLREGDGFMAGWDGDALAGSMEEALERQQEVAATLTRCRRPRSPRLGFATLSLLDKH
ncbi:MAG: hypothetical protein M3371_13545 [Acidobacteriota bacterium]|nr:hypothetical protein [Acidobacteriota bacterium]